jgi:hypothetical protein
LCHKRPTGIDFTQAIADLITNHGDDLVFVEEMNFAFCWMHIDVDSRRVNIQAQVNEGFPAFWQESCVSLLDSLPDNRRLDRPMVDEEKESNPLCTIIGVAGPTLASETPSLIFRFQTDQLISDRSFVNLADTFQDSGSCWHRYICVRRAVFLAGE